MVVKGLSSPGQVVMQESEATAYRIRNEFFPEGCGCDGDAG